ncbi:transcription initiation protein [Streptomyces dysideae]|uniref:Transcription initiation protein n=2 Tax=Streptomyces dysideae TaxID=909626 RepID=A0A117RY61_9ACTN|nr:transcription initiation protein [Streptomyces dysideae]
MKYMLVICDDESDPQGPREITSRPDHVAWIDYMQSSGVELLGGERLRPSGDATSVRARDGEVLISDGPYVEAKEQIGGFALIECADLDQAIEVAARHPFAAHGVIEIRPVWAG